MVGTFWNHLPTEVRGENQSIEVTLRESNLAIAIRQLTEGKRSETPGNVESPFKSGSAHHGMAHPSI